MATLWMHLNRSAQDRTGAPSLDDLTSACLATTCSVSSLHLDRHAHLMLLVNNPSHPWSDRDRTLPSCRSCHAISQSCHGGHRSKLAATHSPSAPKYRSLSQKRTQTPAPSALCRCRHHRQAVSTLPSQTARCSAEPPKSAAILSLLIILVRGVFVAVADWSTFGARTRSRFTGPSLCGGAGLRAGRSAMALTCACCGSSEISNTSLITCSIAVVYSYRGSVRCQNSISQPGIPFSGHNVGGASPILSKTSTCRPNPVYPCRLWRESPCTLTPLSVSGAPNPSLSETIYQ
jgi:hypothetical protein